MALERVKPSEAKKVSVVEEEDNDELESIKGDDPQEGEAEEETEQVVKPAPPLTPVQKKAIQPPPEGMVSQIIPQKEIVSSKVDPTAKELSDCILDSPQSFGIWIGGGLHRFKKGRTRLTNEQKEACLTNPYVQANGASIVRIVRKTKP